MIFRLGNGSFAFSCVMKLDVRGRKKNVSIKNSDKIVFIWFDFLMSSILNINCNQQMFIRTKLFINMCIFL